MQRVYARGRGEHGESLASELPREVARLLVEESFQGSMRKWYDSLPDELTEDIGWENLVDHAVSDLQEEPPLWKDARPLYEITQGISTVKEFMGALREKARDIQLNYDVLLMQGFSTSGSRPHLGSPSDFRGVARSTVHQPFEQ